LSWRLLPPKEKKSRDPRHGKPAGILIGFESEYRLENDPRFLSRIEQARDSLRAGRGIRLEDIETE